MTETLCSKAGTSRQFDESSILARLKEAPGKIGFYYQDLNTGHSFGFQEDQAFEAASVIKLPMFAAVMLFCQRGEASLDDKLLAKKADRVPPCGALYFFTDEPLVDIRTLCGLMITISDNTATNMLMRHFGIDRFNAAFRELGLEKTALNRLLFDAEASAAGKQNYICPREMAELLEKIYRGTLVSGEASRFMEETLLLQQINHKIPGSLNDAVPVAHKTGEDDGISNDVGIVYTREPFVVAFASNQTNVAEFEPLMRQISLELSGL